SAIERLFLCGGQLGEGWPIVSIYPLFAWVSIPLFGLAYGRWRGACEPTIVRRRTWVLGGALLAAFVALRFVPDFGHMLLYETPESWLAWFSVSKYPPSLSYFALTLGVALVLLAVRTRPHDASHDSASRHGLEVFGQTPLFFYLVHLPLLAVLSRFSGQTSSGTFSSALIATSVAVALTYPACYVYRRIKLERSRRWTRYI
ncbi:MAG: OpgC domain-containing protein, partial [Planctomycetota bacterium]